MPKFSETSISLLETCDISLQRLFHRVIKDVDCKVICGSRGAVKQMEAFRNNHSRAVYSQSKHNPCRLIPETITVLSEILRCHKNKESVIDALKTAPHDKLEIIDGIFKDTPSMAVDVIPYPVDWRLENDLPKNPFLSDETEKEFYEVLENIRRWYRFIGFVEATAIQMGVPIICGADFKGFKDMPHFEIKLGA